jgi:hypothetical protein
VCWWGGGGGGCCAQEAVGCCVGCTIGGVLTTNALGDCSTGRLLHAPFSPTRIFPFLSRCVGVVGVCGGGGDGCAQEAAECCVGCTIGGFCAFESLACSSFYVVPLCTTSRPWMMVCSPHDCPPLAPTVHVPTAGFPRTRRLLMTLCRSSSTYCWPMQSVWRGCWQCCCTANHCWG